MKMYTVQMSMNPENYAKLADEYEEAKKKLDKLYAKVGRTGGKDGVLNAHG